MREAQQRAVRFGFFFFQHPLVGDVADHGKHVLFAADRKQRAVGQALAQFAVFRAHRPSEIPGNTVCREFTEQFLPLLGFVPDRQFPRRLADRFVARVAGDFLEGLVDVHDQVVA